MRRKGKSRERKEMERGGGKKKRTEEDREREGEVLRSADQERALKPSTPTLKPKCTSQNKLGWYFRPSPGPGPPGPNSLLPSLHNDIRTSENNCIRADYLKPIVIRLFLFDRSLLNSAQPLPAEL